MSKNEKTYNNYGNSMVKLLKCTKKKDGRTFHNLYVQVSPDGLPIQIDIKFFNIKIKNMLLAIAQDAEIKTYVQVSEVKADENGVIDVEVVGDGQE